jgi:hypothetical protein
MVWWWERMVASVTCLRGMSKTVPTPARFSTPGRSVVASAALRKWLPNFSVCDERRPVLDLPVQPDDRRLAEGLHRAAQGLDDPVGQQLAEVGGGGVDAGSEILHETLSRPGVLDDCDHHGAAGRRVDRATALGEDLVDVGVDLADVHRTLSRVSLV